MSSPSPSPVRRRPSSRVRTTLAALGLAALLLSACAGDGGVGGEVTVGGDGVVEGSAAAQATVDPAGDEPDGEVVTADPAESREPAGTAELTVSGVLGGSSLEGGCVWLDADDGTRYELIAGPSASVAIDPANQVVADSSGTVIAEAGARIEVTGTVDDGLMTFCQVGENLVVESISAG